MAQNRQTGNVKKRLVEYENGIKLYLLSHVLMWTRKNWRWSLLIKSMYCEYVMTTIKRALNEAGFLRIKNY